MYDHLASKMFLVLPKQSDSQFLDPRSTEMKSTAIFAALVVLSAVYAVCAAPAAATDHIVGEAGQLRNITKDPFAAFPAWAKPSSANTCSKPGNCGRAYQACCAGFAAKGYPCTCHLVDGTGKSGNCGTCGTAYSACCVAYGAKGFPCTCDIQ